MLLFLFQPPRFPFCPRGLRQPPLRPPTRRPRRPSRRRTQLSQLQLRQLQLWPRPPPAPRPVSGRRPSSSPPSWESRRNSPELQLGSNSSNTCHMWLLLLQQQGKKYCVFMLKLHQLSLFEMFRMHESILQLQKPLIPVSLPQDLPLDMTPTNKLMLPQQQQQQQQQQHQQQDQDNATSSNSRGESPEMGIVDVGGGNNSDSDNNNGHNNGSNGSSRGRQRQEEAAPLQNHVQFLSIRRAGEGLCQDALSRRVHQVIFLAKQ